MRARTVMGLALAAIVLTAALGCSGGGSSSSETTAGTTTAGASSSDVLRIGTANYIDSLNPFNYIESQAYTAMIQVYNNERRKGRKLYVVGWGLTDDGTRIEWSQQRERVHRADLARKMIELMYRTMMAAPSTITSRLADLDALTAEGQKLTFATGDGLMEVYHHDPDAALAATAVSRTWSMLRAGQQLFMYSQTQIGG